MNKEIIKTAEDLIDYYYSEYMKLPESPIKLEPEEIDNIKIACFSLLEHFPTIKLMLRLALIETWATRSKTVVFENAYMILDEAITL